MSFFSKLFGDPNEKYLRRLQPLVDEINLLEPKFEHFSDAQIKEKTEEFKERLQKGESLNDILPEAFSMVREVAKRTLHQRHFDVQLIGGIVLHQGKITEMKTGEGKTLAATLSLYLNALTEKGCHLVTVNDYLARRDTVWMGQIYQMLGLSISCLNHQQSFLYDPDYKKPTEEEEKIRDEMGGFTVVEDFLRPCSRKEAYLADITYGTNNEFGFDYLRDNMVHSARDQAQREFNFAIIDEVDSILIDEARTPLIISQPDFEASGMYREFSGITPQLKENLDYNIDEKMKVATLTDEGVNKIEKILGVKNIYQERGMKYLHYLEQALRAEVLFQKDKDYVVKDGKVIIVDEFTGRLLPGRRYSGGLHQAVEAKEGVQVQPESRTLATITFQNYFRMYQKLAGMTGTAATSAEEFDKVYGLEVIIVPTAVPMQRQNLPDRVYKTEKGKFKAIVEEIRTRHQKRQPILVGTTSIEKNEYLGKLLAREGISHQILNAKQHEREGQIIAQAGKLGQITVATNMAGRGVDIILGGNPPDTEEAQKVKTLGGLHVIGAQRHEARRIDNQLRGRAGRQGDLGSSQFFISLEDELLRTFGSERIKSLMEILKIPETQPIEAKILSGAIEKAQARVEGLNFDLRHHLLEYDDVISKHRQVIYRQRKKILKYSYQELKKHLLEIIEREIKKVVDFHCPSTSPEDWHLEEVFEEIKTIFPMVNSVHAKLGEFRQSQQILDYLNDLAEKAFEAKAEKEGLENMEKVGRFVCLRTLDFFWKDQLETMERLKDSVRLRAFGGRDPLVEYKTGAYKIFRELQDLIDSQISRTIFKLSIKHET